MIYDVAKVTSSINCTIHLFLPSNQFKTYNKCRSLITWIYSSNWPWLCHWLFQFIYFSLLSHFVFIHFYRSMRTMYLAAIDHLPRPIWTVEWFLLYLYSIDGKFIGVHFLNKWECKLTYKIYSILYPWYYISGLYCIKLHLHISNKKGNVNAT